MTIFTRGNAKIDVLAHCHRLSNGEVLIDALFVTSKFNSLEDEVSELFKDVARRYAGTPWNSDWGANFDQDDVVRMPPSWTP